MAVQDTLIGTLFDGRYRVIRRLGSGGMANVYLAEDEELGRRVAIKVLDEKHAMDEQFIERFRREAKNAASLSHPNIVSIYDRGEAEGTYYIAMEYIEGRTLKELIVARGPLPVDQAVAYARQILGAVRFAHKKGIVHRDIKPHNVLVDTDGRLKVTDFGIARAGASQMTEAGSIIGTAQYLSPEQARGASVDQRSDLYSVGVVLNEMLTGSVPFTGDTPVEIAMKHISAVPEPPSARRPDVPEDLDLVVLRSLAKDPRERFQTAEEMDAELGRVAAGLSVTDATADAATAVLAGSGVSDAAPTAVVRRPPPPPYAPHGGYYYEEPPPPARRSIWPWLLALALVVAAVIAGLYAYERIQDELNANKPVAVPLPRGSRGGARGQQHPRPGSRAEGRPRVQRRHRGGQGLRPGSRVRRADRARQHRHDPRLPGQETRRRARREGPQRRRRRGPTEGRGPRASTGRGLLGAAGRHGDRPGSGRRQARRRGLEGSHQRLAGRQADRDPERGRPELRGREGRARGRGVRRQAERPELEHRAEHRHRHQAARPVRPSSAAPRSR